MANAASLADEKPGSAADSAALLTRVEELLEQAIAEEEGRWQADAGSVLTALSPLIDELRVAVRERDQQLQELSHRSAALARAQADAIVHSAEIIDELERTKQHLSDARAAAEEAARDTQRLADTVFERTHDGVLILSDNACVACNDNALQLLHCTRSELLGTWPAAFQSAQFEDGSPADAAVRELLSKVDSAHPGSLELLLQRPGDSTFWAEITASEFRMKDSGHVLAIVRDITARKQFETELRRHRDFLDNIINAVPDQLSVKASDGTLVVANDAFCDAYALRREEIVGRDASGLLPDELARRIVAMERCLLETGNCQTIEHDLERPNGANAIMSVKWSSFADKSSGDRYIVATSRDITIDRVRERRLRLLASVFNGASEGVAIISGTGRINEANPAFLAMGELAGRSPLGRHLTDILNLGADNVHEVLEQVAAGTSWAGKATTARPGETHRSYWVSLSPSLESDEESRRMIALVSDITELEDTQAKLREQALFDNVTGLPNRRFFREHLEQLIDEPQTRAGQGFHVCFLDLDDFKHVNDSAGHSAGDRLLRAVGRRIQRVVGRETFVARFGGDEFAIVLTDQKLQETDLPILLERLHAAFREPFALRETEAVVGLSVGVTRFPDHAADVDSLMCNADIAMYDAKAAGKNRMRFFTPTMQDGVALRHQIQTKLRRALSVGEISLHFQPKVDAHSGAPAGCEALARWQTNDGRFIPPGDFVPIAEQTGLILALGEVVFRLAAEQAIAWRNLGQAVDLSVNISAQQLRHPRFVEHLQTTLDETGAIAEWFELEITEHAMMDDVDHAIEVLNQLDELGFRVAIDDFGTGYSSLSYLKTFRIHTLKIDLSFVRDVTRAPQSLAIVRSIVSLGTGLGLTVVAEGVEDAEQARLLAKAGCTQLQGYYVGRPMPAADYLQWLAANQSAHVQRR